MPWVDGSELFEEGIFSAWGARVLNMSIPQTLRDLVYHAEWADARMWTSVFEEPDGLFGDEKVKFWLHHVHVVQHAFLQLWRGEELDVPKLEEFQDPTSLARWGRERHAAIQSFLDGVSADRLADELSLPWQGQVEERLGRKPVPATLEQTALQVAMHSAHHRGQLAARLRELGTTPPIVDFIAWVWLGQPETAWPGIADAGRPTRRAK